MRTWVLMLMMLRMWGGRGYVDVNVDVNVDMGVDVEGWCGCGC